MVDFNNRCTQTRVVSRLQWDFGAMTCYLDLNAECQTKHSISLVSSMYSVFSLTYYSRDIYVPYLFFLKGDFSKIIYKDVK